ncbi:MAG TPA: hypothetical protein VM754_05605, partial [Actinomycetota bacterium]|nr:hypothetical protein [Actinomycetota bacterium]
MIRFTYLGNRLTFRTTPVLAVILSAALAGSASAFVLSVPAATGCADACAKVSSSAHGAAGTPGSGSSGGAGGSVDGVAGGAGGA